MTKTQDDFLFEILTEELPPKSLTRIADAFAKNVMAQIEKSELCYSLHTTFSTPRRFGILIRELAHRQPTQKIERRGPALNMVRDDDGKPTQAALGFARSCGVEMSELQTQSTAKGEFLFYSTEIPGKTVQELMPDIIKNALKNLPIPKLMQWHKGEYSFIRPVHNVLMLFGETVIPATFFGLETQRYTLGHRFHQPGQVFIQHPNDYEHALKKAFVIANSAQRKDSIQKQIKKLSKQQNAEALMSESLLTEVNNLVEWPVALLGKFDAGFLEVPQEALILSMQTHQKYFPLTDQQKKLLPFFITVSNIESRDPDTVAHGNERVMRARLSDAAFFYTTDKKQSLASRVLQLKSVIFQKKLGSLHDKTLRVEKLATHIAELLKNDVSITQRAARLSKTDLLTQMVGEFPELQGTMGQYYAYHDQEEKAVAIALQEQYQPRFSGDTLPESLTGKILALADRIDTLVGIFGVGLSPTGDKDPFALRRATLGILRIMIEHELELDLEDLVKRSILLYGTQLTEKNTVGNVLNFCQDRLKGWAQEKGYRSDVFSAVAAIPLQHPLDFRRRLDAVTHFAKLPAAANLSSANKRVNNILSKLTSKPDLFVVQSSLLTDTSEIALAKALKTVRSEVKGLNHQDTLETLARLQPLIDEFFEHVMVMAEDSALKQNRLALLHELQALFSTIADISFLK